MCMGDGSLGKDVMPRLQCVHIQDTPRNSIPFVTGPHDNTRGISSERFCLDVQIQLCAMEMTVV